MDESVIRLIDSPTPLELERLRRSGSADRAYELFTIALKILAKPVCTAQIPCLRKRTEPDHDTSRDYRYRLGFDACWKRFTPRERRVVKRALILHFCLHDEKLYDVYWREVYGEPLSELHASMISEVVLPDADEAFHDWCEEHLDRLAKGRFASHKPFKLFRQVVLSTAGFDPRLFNRLWAKIQTTTQESLMVVWWRMISCACNVNHYMRGTTPVTQVVFPDRYRVEFAE